MLHFGSANLLTSLFVQRVNFLDTGVWPKRDEVTAGCTQLRNNSLVASIGIISWFLM
jgi:hypothetical protein